MFLLIVLLLGILTLVLWEKITEYDLEPLGRFVLAISMLFVLISIISYSISLDTVANMEAFYKRNYMVYTQAVKEFPNSGKAITEDDSTIVVTLPYDRVKLIADYNEHLTWYKKYQNNWFFGGFVAKVPKDLNYIMPEISGQ